MEQKNDAVEIANDVESRATDASVSIAFPNAVLTEKKVRYSPKEIFGRIDDENASEEETDLLPSGPLLPLSSLPLSLSLIG